MVHDGLTQLGVMAHDILTRPSAIAHDGPTRLDVAMHNGLTWYGAMLESSVAHGLLWLCKFESHMTS